MPNCEDSIEALYIEHPFCPAIDPEKQLLPGVAFGRPDQLLSPAYWRWRCTSSSIPIADYLSRGNTLREEVGFCLLGGFGVSLEVNETFYSRLKTAGAFSEDNPPSEHEIYNLLDTPARVRGKPRRYRFPRQRARRISQAMLRLSTIDLDFDSPNKFRDQIRLLEGVGPKTASWITRNWLAADTVAILDIHVLRAGYAIGLFDRKCRLPRDYDSLEARFLEFAYQLDVRASVLDIVIWSDMRKFGSRLVSRRLLN